MEQFKFWCQKVLPLVYDDSLSYYEVLCKVVDYLNNTISDVDKSVESVENLRAELAIVQEWIKNYDTSYAEKIIEDALAKMIYVELSDAGYFIYYIPESWSEIQFGTTGLDITVPGQPEYGRLVLSY